MSVCGSRRQMDFECCVIVLAVRTFGKLFVLDTDRRTAVSLQVRVEVHGVWNQIEISLHQFRVEL